MRKSYFFILLVLSFIIVFSGCLGGRTNPSPNEAWDPNGLACRGVKLVGEGVPVEVHKLDDGYCYPVGIFTKPTPIDQCDSSHFHYKLISIDGYKTRTDDDECGAAKVTDIENTGLIFVGEDVVNSWNETWSDTVEGEDDLLDFIL